MFGVIVRESDQRINSALYLSITNTVEVNDSDKRILNDSAKNYKGSLDAFIV